MGHAGGIIRVWATSREPADTPVPWCEATFGQCLPNLSGGFVDTDTLEITITLDESGNPTEVEIDAERWGKAGSYYSNRLYTRFNAPGTSPGTLSLPPAWLADKDAPMFAVFQKHVSLDARLRGVRVADAGSSSPVEMDFDLSFPLRRKRTARDAASSALTACATAAPSETQRVFSTATSCCSLRGSRWRAS